MCVCMCYCSVRVHMCAKRANRMFALCERPSESSLALTIPADDFAKLLTTSLEFRTTRARLITLCSLCYNYVSTCAQNAKFSL